VMIALKVTVTYVLIRPAFEMEHQQ
jgi:hypothetical protein